VAGVRGLFAEFAGPPEEDGGRVGLGHGETDEDPHDAGEDELDPVEPAPVSGIDEEAADERAD